jgi:glucose/arabinose dehydrogenase
MCRKAFSLSPWAAASLLLLMLTACGGGEESNPFGVQSELVAEANYPIAMAFTPDGRLFYAEQYTGNLRVITPEGELLPAPFAHVDAEATFDWGLNGLAIDPDFESNHYVYVAFMEPAGEGIARPVIMRFTDDGSQGVDATRIVSDLQETNPEHQFFNAVGNIHFGPDGFLYVAIGDYDVRDSAQDLTASSGKMLRVDKEDGSPPSDNPFVGEQGVDPRVFAYGFRKPSDFTFDPETDQPYVSDNGETTCDELDIVEAGNNYGWPMTYESRYADCEANQVTEPIYFFAREGMKPLDHLSVVGPRGMAFASSSIYPLLDDSLLVCEEFTQIMRRLVLSGANQDQVTEDDVVVRDCQLDIAVSPDGIIYYGNSSQIRRLEPTS